VALQGDIHKFAIAGYAEQYFAQHKRGTFFKKVVSVQEMLVHSKVGRRRRGAHFGRPGGWWRVAGGASVLTLVL